jgi:hypothetical protein
VDAGWRELLCWEWMRDRGGRSGQRQFATLQALEFAAAVGDMYSDNLGACGRLAGTRGSAGLVVGSRCSVGRQILRR